LLVGVDVGLGVGEGEGEGEGEGDGVGVGVGDGLGVGDGEGDGDCAHAADDCVASSATMSIADNRTLRMKFATVSARTACQ
jgi:hypothetical protein